MRIDLLRHGETEAGSRYCGSTDVALSTNGWAQMQSAICGRHWDHVLSSPLRRCATFAQALAEARGLPLRIDPRLREMHFGEWEGRSAKELQESDPLGLGRFWRDPWVHPPPGAENLHEMRARVLSCWRELAATRRPGSLLVVTHGGPIRVLRAHLEGLEPGSLLNIEIRYAGLVAVSIEKRARQPCVRC